jgi:hypothetical protein
MSEVASAPSLTKSQKVTNHPRAHIDPDRKQHGPGDVRKQPPNAPQRPAGADGKPPGSELAALLWVIAVLLAVFETLWWWFDRIYSS